jgi:hypothetical protein
MNFIVGVQVYLQNGPDGNSPLLVVHNSVNAVFPEEGEIVSIADLAECAIQIHAETHKETMGYVVTAAETPNGKIGYFIRAAKGKVQ